MEIFEINLADSFSAFPAYQYYCNTCKKYITNSSSRSHSGHSVTNTRGGGSVQVSKGSKFWAKLVEKDKPDIVIK